MLRASALTVVVSMALAIVSVVNSAVTARALGVEGRGLLASALLVVALARGAALLGLGEAFVYHGKNNRLSGEAYRHLASALGVVLVAGALVAAILVPFGPLKQVFPIAIAAIVLASFGSGIDFLISSTRIQPHLHVFNWLRALGPALATASLVVYWLATPVGVMEVLVLQIASTLFAGTVGIVAIRGLIGFWIQVPKGGGLSVLRFLRSGIGFQGIALLGLILTHAHMYIVMLLGTLSAFGIYSAAFGLSRMLSPIQMSIGNVVFASSVGSAESSRGAAAVRAFRITFLPLLALVVVAGMLSPWLVRVFLGQDFSAAAAPLAILMVEAVVAGAAFILGQHLQAVGRVRSVLVRNVISTIPIVVGALILSGESIVTGMAWSMLLASILRLVATLLAYREEVGVGVWWVFPSVSDFKALWNALGGKR